MTTKFQLTVGYDSEKKNWGVVIASEGQHNAFVRPSLRLAMKEAEIRMTKREKKTKAFPLSTIVGMNGRRVRLGMADNYGG